MICNGSGRFSRRLSGCLVSLFLAIFRCPVYKPLDDDFNDTSCFGLCTRFNTAFQHVQPKLEPVYTRYAAPQVEIIAPYAQLAANFYSVHVAPVANSLTARGFVVMQPLVDKYSATISLAKNKMDPYYTAVSDKLDPIVSTVSGTSSVIYTKVVVPFQTKIEPHVTRLSARVMNKASQVAISAFHTIQRHIVTLLSQVRAWIELIVIPRSVGFYRGSIEPHVHKIYHQIIEKGTSKGDKSSTSSITTIEPLSTASLIVEASDEATSGKFIPSSSIAPEKITPTAASTSSSLEEWRKSVDDTSKEAFATFLDDAEYEKRKIVDEVTPQFTELLQQLSTIETEAIAKLSKLVDSIPDGGNDEENDITPDTVKEAFKEHTEELKDAALEVRKFSETVANRILEKTEEVRAATLDVFDEFADVVLSEMGRNLVSIDSKHKIPSSKPGSANWKDWKEFRVLKDRLVDVREEIVDHDINMAEVNQLLRDAQDTAHILTQEAAEYLRSLKMKSDFNFQQAALNRNKRLEEQGIEIEDEPVDAIIYDEPEENATTIEEHASITDAPAQITDVPAPMPEPEAEEDSAVPEQAETPAYPEVTTSPDQEEDWEADEDTEPSRIIVTRTFFETFGETPHQTHDEL